jgi:HAD superfamily hydrolase (TIGR01509 family)
MTKVAALLLDLDGTLAHSLPVMFQSYNDFLGRFGRSGTRQEFEDLNGPTLSTIVRILADRHGLPDSQNNLLALYREILEENYPRLVKPNAGADILVSYAKSRSLRIALVTSSMRRIAESFLEAQRLSDHFSTIVAGDDVACGKPDPMIYHQALDRLGVPPDVAMAVEDSRAGAMASTAAGIRTIFLKSGATTPPESPLVIACAGDLFEVRDCLRVEAEHCGK